ncbi:hypothetical protein [Halopiger goleimassiliensis]|uniref:hypothetical protein n=1 Tax=Halopiger goleimassiliensis TaxID=1293048 RepID=UPI0006775ECB|nr:hypothetical protein [Halopiger goleimassiliensis]
MDSLLRFLRRYVARSPDPDAYSVYASFPALRTDRPGIGAVRNRIDDLEYACEGRLDVTVTRKRLVVRTDAVASEQFDRDAFGRFLDGVETLYGDRYDVVHYAKSRECDRGLEKSHVVVPVKPLFAEPSEARKPEPERSVSVD